MNGARALLSHPGGRAASTSASPTRAPPRCTSSPPSTTCPRCGACCPCSRAWPPEPPTATPAWPDARRPRCCTWARASATAWPTCTTPAAPARPVVNIVGDHATYHAPLRRAAPVGHRRHGPQRSRAGHRVRARRATWPPMPPSAVAAARGRRAAWPPWCCRRTLVVGGRPRPARRRSRVPRGRRRVPRDASSEAAKALRSGRAGGAPPRRPGAARGRACEAASRVAAATGARLLGETFPANLERGAGRPGRGAAGLPGRVRPGPARRRAPPGPGRGQVRRCRSSPTRARPSDLVPGGLHVHTLAGPGEDVAGALEALADAVGRRRRRRPRRAGGRPRTGPTGPSPRDPGRGRRGHAARGRHRGRRGQHLGAVRPGGHGRRAAGTTG